MTEQLPGFSGYSADLARVRDGLANSPFAPPEPPEPREPPELGSATPVSLRFTVLGRPQPAGSKRGFPIRRDGAFTGRVAMVDANPKAKPWQAVVRSTAVDALDGGELLLGPLALEVVFVLARPAGHYGSGRNAARLKPSAPPWPITRPDTTKLLRGLEDALIRLVWRDDSQVVRQTATKVYGAPERCEVTITPLDPIGAAVREAAR